MHAYLIISKDPNKAFACALDIAKTWASTLTPFTLQKIVDVRDLKRYTKLTLSPTCFFVEDIQNATIDALNAFLKHLEEPGRNVSYILTASSEDKVLGTIVSRCQVIRLQTKREIGRPDINFIELSMGAQLSYADKIKKRDNAILFLQNLIAELHQELLDNSFPSVVHQLFEAQKTLTALEKNGNVTIQLTRFIVGINA